MRHRDDTGAGRRQHQPDRGRSVSVGTYTTRAEAELVRGRLVSAGIFAWVAADDAGGAYPFDLADGAHVMVAEADLADAAALLAEPADDR